MSGSFDREPTEDERQGMEWWNGLTQTMRLVWLQRAIDEHGIQASVADAWECFKNTPRQNLYANDPDDSELPVYETYTMPVKGPEWEPKR